MSTNVVITYRNAYQQINTLSNSFLKKSKGNPILLQGKNSISWIIHFLALLRARIPILPLDNKTSEIKIWELAQTISADAIVKTDSNTVQWLQQTNCAHLPNQLAVIFQTSGSTGKSKLALRSLASLIEEGYRYSNFYGISSTDTILATLPLHHAFILGMITGCILTESSPIYVLPEFNTNTVKKLMQDNIINIVPVVPSLAGVIAESFRKTSSLQHPPQMIIGAGATSKSLEFAIAKNIGLVPSRNYGSSETGPTLGSCGKLLGDGPTGKPLLGVQTCIRPTNEGAVLYIKTDTPCLGYWIDGGLYPAPIDQKGWYYTGDLACQNAEEFISIKGRIGNMIRRGGKFIAPDEIIQAICCHPDVINVQLHNEKDIYDNDIIVATVWLKSGSNLRDSDIREFLRNDLDDLKVPQKWYWKTSNDLLLGK